jgi:hypothetical protein
MSLLRSRFSTAVQVFIFERGRASPDGFRGSVGHQVSAALSKTVVPGYSATTPRFWLVASALRDCLLIPFADEIPVHYAPECFDILGAPVLMFQVVGMFPDIDAKQRHLMF